jgi:hypothetical protein
MKHASADSLRLLRPLIEQVRQLQQLREPKPGSFYRKGSAFMHFHEDPAGLFADVKLEGREFTRLPVSTPEQQSALLARVRHVLASQGIGE